MRIKYDRPQNTSGLLKISLARFSFLLHEKSTVWRKDEKYASPRDAEKLTEIIGASFTGVFVKLHFKLRRVEFILLSSSLYIYKFNFFFGAREF